MGPAADSEGDRAWVGVVPIRTVPDGLDIELLGLGALVLKGVIPCDTPSGKMNCSRSSMFVLPLANYGIVQDSINQKRKPRNK